MVEKFTGYKASNGKAFDTEREAWIAELFVKLIPITDNAGICTKTTEGITDNANEFRVILEHICALTPLPAPLPDTCWPAASEND